MLLGFAATSAILVRVQRATLGAAYWLEPRGPSQARRELAPGHRESTWMTPVKRDPLDVPLEDKIACFRRNEAALR